MTKEDPRISKLLSAQEAADLIDTSIANIYYWIEQKKLRVVQRGSHRLVYRKEVEKVKAEK